MDTPRAAARVLLVDDQPDQVEMYHFALEQAGFVVDDAEDGTTAIAQARAECPDVIVLDIRLPDMSGWDVCDALRRDPRTERIPIIILTAAASSTLAQEAADHGCAAHLVKPCYPDDLTQMVRQILAAA
jgi:two-component system phosphate regulon response regulator PhoB